MLHVTNGDSTAGTLAEADLGGRVLPWRDALHAGPVPALAPTELRGVRAEFMAARGWAGRDAAQDDMRARDEMLAAALGTEPVVLWFEHDLYDQPQLIQIVSRVPDGADVDAILADRFLGELEAEQLAALWPRRRPLTAEARGAARAAWRAFTAPDPAPLAALEVDGALPHLPGALARLREEYPATTDGLARSERQALAAIAAGADEPVAAFLAAQRAEEAPFSGDRQFFDVLDELAAAEPLIERDPLRLTAAGRAVLAGEADAVSLRGVDRWVGGAWLDGSWRWDRSQHRLTTLN